MGRDGIKRGAGAIAATFVGVLLWWLAAPSLQAATLLDRLIAEVNGEAILQSEIDDKVTGGALIAVTSYPLNEDEDPFLVALHDEINLRLILQRAAELEIRIDDTRLDEEIERFMKMRNLSRRELMQALASQGMSYEQYRKDFRNQSVLNQFQGREILPNVNITERDVEIYFLNQTGGSNEHVKITLRQILVAQDSSASPAVKRGKAALVERIHQELNDGMDFEKAARIYSDHQSSRDKGGLMSPLYLKDLAPFIREAVLNLSEGEFSPPIEAPMGYLFFYLEEKEFAGSTEFERLKPQLEAQLRQEEVVNRTIQWLADQRRRSEIRIID